MRLRYLGLAALAALTWVGVPEATTSATPPDAPVSPSHLGAPRVAILIDDPMGTSSALHFVDIDSGSAQSRDADLGPTVATIDHREGAAVSAVTSNVGGVSRVFVIADATADPALGPADKDLSYAGSLVDLEAGAAPVTLADRVVHASRAVTTADGKAVIARGEPGSTAARGAFREDVLWVDEIDPTTHSARTLLSLDGYLLYVIGTSGREVVVYRVSASGADIVAVDRDTLKIRPIAAKIPELARDFSIDSSGKALTFTDRAFGDPKAEVQWSVTRIDLSTTAATELVRGRAMSMIPFSLPNDDVLVTLDPSKGAGTLFGPPLPLGQGAAHVAGLSSDNAFLTGTTNLEGGLGRPFVLDLDRKLSRFVDIPRGERATVAGFIEVDASKGATP